MGLIDESGVATFTYTATYAKHEPITVTILAKGMVEAGGAVEDKVISSSKVTWGSSTSVSLKKLESSTGIKVGNPSKADFTFAGKRYVYTGSWTSVDGAVDLASGTISLYNKAGEDSATKLYFEHDVTLVFAPEYAVTEIGGLDFFYIDNISTGSGSWSNADASGIRSAFSSMSHTFANPEIASPNMTPHYRFVQWIDLESGATYAAGDKFTYTAAAGTVSTVRVYAQLQPSVTVNY